MCTSDVLLFFAQIDILVHESVAEELIAAMKVALKTFLGENPKVSIVAVCVSVSVRLICLCVA